MFLGRLKYIIIFFLIFLVAEVTGQELGFKLYTTKDGLISNQIWKIRQDPKGYLWLASIDGCSRFDGLEFKNFSKKDGLSTSQTWDFAFYDDTVFVLLNNGIDIIVNDEISSFKISSNFKIYGYNFLHIENELCILCIDKNTKQSHVLNIKKRRINHSFDKILTYNNERRLIHQIDRELFFLIKPADVLEYINITKTKEGIYDTTNVNHFKYRNCLFKELFGHNIFRVKVSDSIYGFNKNSDFLFNYNYSQSLKIAKNSYIILDPRNLYYLHNNKILKLNYDFYYNYCVIQAMDKTIWLATDRGLVKVFINGVQNFPHHSGYITFAWSIFPENDNKLWLGSMTKGLFCYENGKLIKSIKSINGETLGPYYGSEQGFSNDMVIPTGNKGLFVYNFDNQKPKLIKCNPNEDCLFVWKDTIANRILSGMRVLYYLNSDYTLDSILTVGDHIHQQRINAATRKGNYYYFTSGNDVLEFNMLTKEQRWLGLIDIRFNSISCDFKKNLWVASDAGIYLLSPKDTIVFMKDNNFWALIIDKKNKLFAVSKEGLYVLNLKDYYNTGNAQFFHFGEDEGFSGAGDENAFYLDKNGDIWLPGASNNVVIKPNELSFAIPQLKTNIVIANCISDSQNVNILSFPDYVLSYKNKDFYFGFYSVCLTSPSKVRYQYRLKGYDTKWSEPSSIRYVRYTNITHGDYSFEVRAALYNRFDEAEISSISFTIETPFWLRWWFVSISLIVFFILILIIIRWRIKVGNRKLLVAQKIQQLEMEVLQMQIKPHFIGNSLELIRNNIIKGRYENSLIAIQSFGMMLRNVTQNINQPFISLKQEIEIIENYLIFQKLRYSEKFDYQLPIKNYDLLDDIEVPPLILQAFVENSIVHGFQSLDIKGLITIDFELNDDNIIILIIDNGVGRKKSKLNKHNEHKSVGISNSINRLKLFEKSISEPVLIFDLEQGTKVEIKIKI